MSKDKSMCQVFERFIAEKDKVEEREMMEDFVVHNFFELQPWEIAQAIREGVTKLETIEQVLSKL